MRHLQVYLSLYRTDISRTPFFQVMFVLVPFRFAFSHIVLVWGSGKLIPLFQDGWISICCENIDSKAVGRKINKS